LLAQWALRGIAGRRRHFLFNPAITIQPEWFVSLKRVFARCTDQSPGILRLLLESLEGEEPEIFSFHIFPVCSPFSIRDASDADCIKSKRVLLFKFRTSIPFEQLLPASFAVHNYRYPLVVRFGGRDNPVGTGILINITGNRTVECSPFMERVHPALPHSWQGFQPDLQDHFSLRFSDTPSFVVRRHSYGFP
jgi:hypothetical protein